MPLGGMTCDEPYSCKANLKRLRKTKSPPVRTTDGGLLPSNGGRPETSAPSYKRSLWGNGSDKKRTPPDGLSMPNERGPPQEAGSTSMLNEALCGVRRTPVNSGRRPQHHESE